MMFCMSSRLTEANECSHAWSHLGCQKAIMYYYTVKKSVMFCWFPKCYIRSAQISGIRTKRIVSSVPKLCIRDNFMIKKCIRKSFVAIWNVCISLGICLPNPSQLWRLLTFIGFCLYQKKKNLYRSLEKKGHVSHCSFWLPS